MNIPSLLKALKNNNIHFRPKGLSRLKELFGQILEPNIASKFINYSIELQFEYLDTEEVEKLLEMIQQGIRDNSQDQVQTLFKRIQNSIIILDYFESQQFQLQCAAADKQKMTLNRLTNIESLLRKDPRYAFGFQSDEQVSLSQIGSVIGSIDKIHCILGILIKNGNSYYISEGMIKLKVNISNAQNQSLFKSTNSEQATIGIVNEGSIVILQGEWNDHHSHFDVFNFAIPNFNLKKKIRDDMKGSDLKRIRKLDTFGVFQKVIDLLNIEESATLERQKAFNFFFKAKNDQVWILSNFTLDNLIAIKNFEKLLSQAINFNLKPPEAIIFAGQFSNAQIPNPEKLYGNELVKLIKQFHSYLQTTLMFFVPSYNDFPLAYSMPKTPINLSLYMDQPTEMMHVVCNPCKLSMRGFNIVLTRNDISKEIRRNHIQQMQTEHTHLCETIISQQYLGTFQSRQICYKWNYDHAMHLDPNVEVIVLCDLTIEQFKYVTFINDTQIINPGNFLKGEFGTLKFNRKKQTISCETSRVETV